MKNFLVILLLSVACLAQPTTVQLVSRTAITVGSTACLPIAPCDNTVASPSGAIGIVTASVLNSNGRSYTITVQVNGEIAAPIPFGTNCSTGDLVGDVDGSGTLGDLGDPSSVVGPVSYVGLCIGDNSALTEMSIVIQPGYIQ